MDGIETWKEQTIVDEIDERVNDIKLISELLINEENLEEFHEMITHLFSAFCLVSVQQIKSQIVAFRECMAKYWEYQEFLDKLNELEDHLLKKMCALAA